MCNLTCIGNIIYRIVQNGGGGKLWRIGNFKNLVGKTLANCNELPLVFLDENTPLVRHAKLKTTIVYFIITCRGKMVHAFAVSSVVRDTTNIKMFRVLPLTEQNFLVKELATFSVSILKSTHAAFLPCQIWTDSYFSIV